MQTSFHGTPCWYELGTTDLEAAGRFYGDVLGWSVADSGMPGMAYHLATATDGGMVAGMMSVAGQQGPPPPNWCIYIAVDDADATAAAITERGGAIVVPPADIPGTGRFAICADPQGAVFGILQPLPMDTPPSTFAFDQSAAGHGNWHELMSSDPAAGFAFYSGLFGWTEDEAMDMGEMGTYQLFQDKGRQIGGMMRLQNLPHSSWLPYFGVDGVDATLQRITAGGGTVHNGPDEVPGGGWVAAATDPQGAWFAVVGPREASGA